MFTMPAIYNSSMKAEDGCMGTLHLNALNGSSGVLDISSSGNTSNLNRNGTFGNLFPPSPNDVNPCRQKNNSKVFGETLKSSQSSSNLFTLITPSSTSASSKPIKTQKELHTASETRDFIGPRRSSLDLNATTINTHPRYEDRSFSLVEVIANPDARVVRHFNGTTVERGMAAGLNLSTLSVNQDSLKSTDYRSRHNKLPALDRKSSALDSKLSSLDRKLPALDSTCKSCHSNNKKSNGDNCVPAMPGKTRKFLEKIKSNITDYNIHFKYSRSRSESKPEERPMQLSTSKSGRLQQNKPRYEVDTAVHHTGSRHAEGKNSL